MRSPVVSAAMKRTRLIVCAWLLVPLHVASVFAQPATPAPAGNGARGYYKDATGVTATLQGPALQPLASLSLPAGSYLLWANVRARQLAAPGSGIECVLGNATQRHDPRAAGSALATFMGEITLHAPGTAIVECSAVDSGAYSAESVAMSAVRIGTVESTVESTDTPECQKARMYWDSLMSRPQDLCGILRDGDLPESSPMRMYTWDFELLLPELHRKFPNHTVRIRTEFAGGWRFTELCGPNGPKVQLTVKQTWNGFTPSNIFPNYFFTLIGSYEVDLAAFDEDRPWAHLNDYDGGGNHNPAWSLYDSNIDEFSVEYLFNFERFFMPYVVPCP